jgi:hypothetical protein
MRARVLLEALLALATTVATGLTLVAPQWIEALLGVDPDGGSGSAEWAVVAGLAALCSSAWWVAGRDYRRWRRTQQA